MASLGKANEQLLRQVGNHRNINNRTREDSHTPLPKTMCPHCKIKVMHAHDNGFWLEKKSTRRPRGRISRLWRWGTSKILDNKVNELSNPPLAALLSSNRYTPPPPPLIWLLTKLKQKQQSEIVDSGASGYFFTRDAPKKNVDPTAPHI